MRIMMIAVVALAAAGCVRTESQDIDALRRSRVDGLNKESFRLRYDDARRSERYARWALRYIADSLPAYSDGRLRAWNNLATAYFNQARYDSVEAYVDSVLSFAGRAPNREIEQVLSRLMMARLLQRNCDIASSYQLLHDIESSGKLDSRSVMRRSSPLLYDLACSEFYITTTILNYHYRSKSQYEQSELLTEMERRRGELRCDYAEDMSLNYAIAYGYYALCSDTTNQPQYLHKMLEYSLENMRILGDSARYSSYHLANTYQLIGFMLWSKNLKEASWEENRELYGEIRRRTVETFGFDLDSVGDDGYAFLKEAASLFWLHEDPYQRLGAVVAVGRYCMGHGDTATARRYFSEALYDSTLLGIAPKFEARLYEGLLTSGSAESQEEVSEWTRKELSLLEYIKQNEKADFVLQQELSDAHRHSTTFMVFTAVLLVLAVALTGTLLLLRRRTKALQEEKTQLQAAKQQDVERIANVETCLSVLRHDITPFVTYLQNDKLPEELKREVTGQLVRTFENIKSWTNLSIPSGMQFRLSEFGLQETFDSVRGSINNIHGEKVRLKFRETRLRVSGDRLLTEIMLRNLVNNAVQHTEAGMIEVAAESYAEDGRFVHITVKDTGAGMSAEQLESLFRSDKKIKGTPEAGYGSGFGLILCRYIIKRHDDHTLRGCRIWAESEEGRGSTFHIVLAAAQEERRGEQ